MTRPRTFVVGEAEQFGQVMVCTGLESGAGLAIVFDVLGDGASLREACGPFLAAGPACSSVDASCKVAGEFIPTTGSATWLPWSSTGVATSW